MLLPQGAASGCSKEDEKEEMSLGCVARGTMISIMKSGVYTKDEEKANGGVEIVCAEEITDLKSSESFDQNGKLQIFLKAVRTLTNPMDFRLQHGNQAIGGAYTLCRGDFDDCDESLYTEVAVRDGNLRVRCKYLYTCHESEKKSSNSIYEFTGLMVIKEHLQGTSPVELKHLLTENVGFSIYDPQNFGRPGKDKVVKLS